MTALVPNPYFEKSSISPTDANRLLRVTRLDGPTKACVMNLIDRTLIAEEIGLMGRAYIDTGGPHAKGDEWIRSAGAIAEGAFFDMTTRRVNAGLPRSTRRACYPWAGIARMLSAVAFATLAVRGAICFHLHSFSGTSVHFCTRLG